MELVRGFFEDAGRVRRPAECVPSSSSLFRDFSLEDAGRGADRLEVVFLDVLEVLVCAVRDAFAGGLVADDDSVLVHLQDGDSPHLRHRPFDGGLQGAGFVVAVAEDEDFFGRHDGAHTYGQCRGGYVLRLAAEEAGIGHAGVGGERLLACAAGEGAARLVESNVAVGADAADKEVYAAGLLNHLLVVGAFGGKVFGVAVEDVDVLFRAVNVVEQVGGHERMVALGVGFGQADVFVHIECKHVLEAHAAFFVGFHECLVHPDGRRACGQAENKGLLGGGVCGVDFPDHIVGGPLRQAGVVRFDNYSHDGMIFEFIRFGKKPPCICGREVLRWEAAGCCPRPLPCGLCGAGKNSQSQLCGQKNFLIFFTDMFKAAVARTCAVPPVPVLYVGERGGEKRGKGGG